MKLTSLISATALALALAAPVYAQTAPTGIPADLVNNSVVQQVNAQLTAQGYTITDVQPQAGGGFAIIATAANGELRLITIDPQTGSVSDTVTSGIPDTAPGISPEGTFEHESNETAGMETLETEGGNGVGSDDNGSNNDNGGTGGNDDNGSNNDNGSTGGNDDNGSTGGNDDNGSNNDNGTNEGVNDNDD